MASELTGAIPKLPFPYAKTLVNRAWADIRRKNLWSFQLFEANWVSPEITNDGTVTTVQGDDEVVFDTTASTAIIPLDALTTFPTPLLQRQFRVGSSTIYNIREYSEAAGVVTLTLDRPYTDASGSDQAYSIFQCYYPVPMEDFRAWMNIRDMINFNDLNIYSQRMDVDLMDPQRTMFYLPTYCVPYMTDQNPDSDTYRFQMYELWGQPQYSIVYQLYGIRKGTVLAEDDELPPQVGEDCVLSLSRMYAYEWAEANKGDMPRTAGTDWRFLMGAARAEYDGLYRQYRMQDRDACDNWYAIRRRPRMFSNISGFYNSIAGVASAGAPW